MFKNFKKNIVIFESSKYFFRFLDSIFMFVLSWTTK